MSNLYKSILRLTKNNSFMFSNLLRYSIRSFKRQRSYIIINILGLSIGIACSLLIALFVISEAGYDKFNVKKEDVSLCSMVKSEGRRSLAPTHVP